LNPWLPPCEICTGHSCKELRGVEDRGRRVRTTRSVAIDGWIGGHDPPRSSGGLAGCYGHRLLPMCCSSSAATRCARAGQLARVGGWDGGRSRPPQSRRQSGRVEVGFAIASIQEATSLGPVEARVPQVQLVRTLYDLACAGRAVAPNPYRCAGHLRAPARQPGRAHVTDLRGLVL
jgi:hypothetical protein